VRLLVAALLGGGTLLAACGSSPSSSGPAPSGPEAGTVVSSTPIPAPPGATGWKVTYRTTLSDGSPAESLGVVYAPSGPAPHPRPVVSWAQGTTGAGPDCGLATAPDPAARIPGLDAMLHKGWVVTATNYTGMGTPGTLPYLVGKTEAHNVIDAVRAARHLPTGAGTAFAAFGHSQGGNSVLFTADLARSYAPELKFVGVAALAPAADLVQLFDLQAHSPVAWVIGPQVVSAWPAYYPHLERSQVASATGLAHYQSISQICISSNLTAITAAVAPVAAQPFFAVPSLDQAPSWLEVAKQNTPPPPGVPVFVGQGTADVVVLPPTTTSLIRSWCADGVHLTVDWVAGASHFSVVPDATPSALTFLSHRFAGDPAPACTPGAATPPAS
jgi:hypothetical protein